MQAPAGHTRDTTQQHLQADSHNTGAGGSSGAAAIVAAAAAGTPKLSPPQAWKEGEGSSFFVKAAPGPAAAALASASSSSAMPGHNQHQQQTHNRSPSGSACASRPSSASSAASPSLMPSQRKLSPPKTTTTTATATCRGKGVAPLVSSERASRDVPPAAAASAVAGAGREAALGGAGAGADAGTSAGMTSAGSTGVLAYAAAAEVGGDGDQPPDRDGEPAREQQQRPPLTPASSSATAVPLAFSRARAHAHADADEDAHEAIEIERSIGGACSLQDSALHAAQGIGIGDGMGVGGKCKEEVPEERDDENAEHEKVDGLLSRAAAALSLAPMSGHGAQQRQQAGRRVRAASPSSLSLLPIARCGAVAATESASPSARTRRSSSIGGIFDLESDSPPTAVKPLPSSSPPSSSSSSAAAAAAAASKPRTLTADGSVSVSSLHPPSSSSSASTTASMTLPRTPSPFASQHQPPRAVALGMRNVSPNSSSSSLRYEYRGSDALQQQKPRERHQQQQQQQQQQRLSPASSALLLRSAYDAAPRTGAIGRPSPSPSPSPPPSSYAHAGAIPILFAGGGAATAAGDGISMGMGLSASSGASAPPPPPHLVGSSSFSLSPSPSPSSMQHALKLTLPGIGSASLGATGGRAPFDTAPSFSSPLAHAAVLPDPDFEDFEEQLAHEHRHGHGHGQLGGDLQQKNKILLQVTSGAGGSTSDNEGDANADAGADDVGPAPKSSQREPERWQSSKRTASATSQGTTLSDGDFSPEGGAGDSSHVRSSSSATSSSDRRSVSDRHGRVVSASEIKFLPRERIASGGNPVPFGSMAPPPLHVGQQQQQFAAREQQRSASASAALSIIPAGSVRAGKSVDVPSRSRGENGGSPTFASSGTQSPTPLAFRAGAGSSLQRANSTSTRVRGVTGPSSNASLPTAPLAIAVAGRGPASGSAGASHHGSSLSVSSNVSVLSTDSMDSISPPHGTYGGSAASLATSWGGGSISSGAGGGGGLAGEHSGSTLGLMARRSVGPSGSLGPAGSGRRKRRPSAPAMPSAHAHRRARSLGGVLLADMGSAQGTSSGSLHSNTSNDTSSSSPASSKSFLGGYVGSPIGGPDGVDPSLVAAINRNDSSFPGTPVNEHPRLLSLSAASGMSLAAAGSMNPSTTPYVKSERDRSKTTSSTSIGSQQSSLTAGSRSVSRSDSVSSGMILNRKRSDLLSILPDTRALANSYPAMDDISSASEADKQAEASGLAPSPPIGGPEGYKRLRARSQTVGLASPKTAAAAQFGTSASASSSSRLGGSMPRSGGNPLADAIRLQRVPTSVRLAGDLFLPPSPRLQKSQHTAGGATSTSTATGRSLGLGIGNMGAGGLQSHSPSGSASSPWSPQTPLATRSPSPVHIKNNKGSPPSPENEYSSDQSTNRVDSRDPLYISIPRRRYSALPSAPHASLSSSVSPNATMLSTSMSRPQIGLMDSPPGAAVRTTNRKRSSASLAPLFSLPSSPNVSLRQFVSSRQSSGSDAIAPWRNAFDDGNSTRPAPWIASSQEVKLRPNLLDQWDPLACSNTATDEYAKIIVASRNAKMQKWKSSSMIPKAGSPALGALPQMEGSTSGRVSPKRTSLTSAELLRKREKILDVATSGFEPDEKASSFERGEIEWVDWLDEYQRMKETKMRTEQEEEMKKAAPSATVGKSEDMPSSGSAYLSLPPNAHLRPRSPLEPRLSKSQSQSQLLGEGGTPRRPSEAPRSAALSSTSTESRSTSLAGLSPRPSAASDSWTSKQRSLSSSLSMVRTYSEKPTGNMLASGKKRKNLGGKIEAWWSAVKSGFSAHGPEDIPRQHPTAIPSPPSGKGHRRMLAKDKPESGFAAASGGFGQHARASSSNKPLEAETSGRTLRSQTSAHTLKSRSDAFEKPAKTDAASAAPLVLASREASASSPSLSSAPGSEDTTGKEGSRDNIRKKQPPLTLKLDKNLSTFTSAAFRSDQPRSSNGQRSGSDSPPDSPRGTRKLSQAWGRPTPTSASSSERSQFEIALTSHRDSAGKARHSVETPPTMSHSKDFTINYMRQQIRQRLALSKQTCDNELRKIVAAINRLVEEELQEARNDEAESQGGLGLESGVEEPNNAASYSQAPVQATPSRQSIAEPQHSSAIDDTNFDPDETAHAIGLTPSETQTRPSVELAEYRLAAPPQRAADAVKSYSSQGVLHRHPGLRSLRSAHARYNHSSSNSTSRSTSRSQSPMPAFLSGAVPLADSPNLSPARRSRLLPAEDLSQAPYIPALQDIVTLAVEVIDTPISVLTQRSGMCSEIIANVQAVGRNWDDHPDWPGRNWYVELLLHIASLSRVVEWWVAEKANWQDVNDEDDNQEAHPVKFILGPQAQDMDPIVENRSAAARAHSVASPAKADDARDSGVDSAPSGTNSPALLPVDKRVRRSRTNSHVVHPKDSKRATSAARTSAKHDIPNVLMELALDGDQIIYLSPSWRHVIGSEPDELIDTLVSILLAPVDEDVFQEASAQLQANPAHTVEVSFRLRLPPAVSSKDENVHDTPLFQRMEGKGMLMHDRQLGILSHTMWVFKPTSPPEPEATLDGDSVMARATSMSDQTSSHGFAATIPLEPVMCRICERDIPTWFFETHSEICNEVHRLEMEIAECNESLLEVKRAAQSIAEAIENGPETDANPPCYQGVPVTTPPPSQQPPSALEGLHRSLSLRQTQPALVRKQHLRALDSAVEALQAAASISTPAVKEDEANVPVEKQRLLSPTSEDKISQTRGWTKPLMDDPALDALMDDAESHIRAKLSGVNRMVNTIVYVETVRFEWEERVEAALVSIEEAENSGTPSSKAETGDGVARDNALHALGSGQALNDRDDDLQRRTTGLLVEDIPPSDKSELHDGAVEHANTEVPPMEEGAMSESLANLPGIPIPSAATHAAHNLLRSGAAVGPQYLSSADGSLGVRGSNGTPPFSPRLSPAAAASSHGGQSSRKMSMSQHRGSIAGSMPMSPRLPPTAPASRPTATTIKDFDIIKPISKGAFGSVFLAKKRATGDYYAIKVLKKSDMIAKNQILNVKAERMILMTQTQSPFVVKLLFTFNDTNYLYLVMEYLPGGDCASLCKMLGGLDIEWTKQYIAEIVNGLDHLHCRGIVHRDLKPDNVLIDQKGHLKLTDFGLSKIGLLGRQTQAGNRFGVISLNTGRRDSGQRSNSQSDGQAKSSDRNPPLTPSYQTQVPHPARNRILSTSTEASDSSGSDGGHLRAKGLSPAYGLESPQHAFKQLQLPELPKTDRQNSSPHDAAKRFAGTPDYLAPESILGIGIDDMAVDWWALGVILYEFVYGYPPFHDDTVDKVFDNILSRRIEWHDGVVDVPPEARDLMEKLMCSDPKARLGTHGADEVKVHPFFEGIDWSNLTTGEGPFVPQVSDPESTDYFDLRGAVSQSFVGEDGRENTKDFANAIGKQPDMQPTHPSARSGRSQQDASTDAFGSFRFKNLPVLKQANDEVVRKMRGDQLPPMTQTLEQPLMHARHRSLSGRAGQKGRLSIAGPPSPSTSVSSQSSTPSRSTAPTSPSVMPHMVVSANQKWRTDTRLHSGLSAGSSDSPSGGGLQLQSPVTGARRGAAPGDALSAASASMDGAMSRFRALSLNVGEPPAMSPLWSPLQADALELDESALDTQDEAKEAKEAAEEATPRADMDMDMGGDGDCDSGGASGGESESSSEEGQEEGSDAASDESDTVRCLIAEDNPIALKMLENILVKVGCECRCVRNGAEAVSLAMGETKFAVMFIDVTLPIVDGHDVSRMVKSTRNANSLTPIIALAGGLGRDGDAEQELLSQLLDASNSVFDGILAKPLEKSHVTELLRKLGLTALQQQARPQVPVQGQGRTDAVPEGEEEEGIDGPASDVMRQQQRST
ncbi:hypothetical protein K437DRAFT_266493 [Tilletiaria anomala UBC 951]|uniref:non-specific serine/threonine protein kinase n=1 Tax=Tilletiaria anomala (strain ATCC 24038 / CBS 436.72 / UBC 951) TaxID=1037660 RepID=A0A066WJA5_TILAU|nr:uncharacterized protein K437DRAFT_266493 [Tilletiaria anomala UBC 951]KDN52643.1 hypothetical protein K437DRAFT_266493 [Tilletiaria anomala UBC 951]